jgi:hypothetical protein
VDVPKKIKVTYILERIEYIIGQKIIVQKLSNKNILPPSQKERHYEIHADPIFLNLTSFIENISNICITT